jgi:hypothetical protein
MTCPDYRPRRQGIAYPTPTNVQWRRILRHCTHVDTGFTTPCWIWLGRLDTDGYGECKYNGAKRFVHRIAYASLRGVTPAGRDVDHKCHQRACCNPEHLEAKKPIENAGKHPEAYQQSIQVNSKNYLDYAESQAGLEPVPF